MSDPERKKKMISLRLSDAEYTALKSQFRTHGARNVSDLARLALQQMMHTAVAPRDTMAVKLADLEDRVHALECEISVIADRDLSNAG
jgi:hypothetical protein